MRCLVVKGQPNKSLQVSRDCVSLIKSLFSQIVATAGHLNSNVGLLMNSSVTARLLTALLFVSHAFPPAVAQSVTASRSYRMGTVGNLEITVPSSWRDNSKTLDKPQGVTLAYRLPSRTDFYMKVTAVWIPPEKRSSVEPAWVRHAVEQSARDIVGSSKPLPALTQISSTGGNGYYFQTDGYDRFPIGEFHYIIGGVLDLGGVTFVFTTYSNTKDLPELADALRVVESARFVATKT